jgi:hypothetical protein
MALVRFVPRMDIDTSPMLLRFDLRFIDRSPRE